MFSKFVFVFVFVHFLLANGDVTSMLGSDPNFSTFNAYLTQSQVATSVSGQVSTVLAVENGAMQQLKGQANDTIQKIMAFHVVVGYYDEAAIKALNGTSDTVRTLNGNMFLTKSNTGSIMFVSRGSVAHYIKQVDSVAGRLAILQVSNILLPPGVTLDTKANNTGNVPAPGQAPGTNSTAPPGSNSTAPTPPSSSNPKNSTSSPGTSNTPTTPTSPGTTNSSTSPSAPGTTNSPTTSSSPPGATNSTTSSPGDTTSSTTSPPGSPSDDGTSTDAPPTTPNANAPSTSTSTSPADGSSSSTTESGAEKLGYSLLLAIVMVFFSMSLL
ncbi:hypothetical protein ACFE04_031642 [Oxalis oulophora]